MKSLSLALVAVLALASNALAQCGVQRASQLDPSNIGLGCANGRCGVQALTSASAVAAPAPIAVQPQTFALQAPVVQQYTTSTMPLYVVQPSVAQLISTPSASAASSATATSSSASAIVAPNVATQQLVVPQLVQPVSLQQTACSGGSCSRRQPLRTLQLRAPRSRSRSVSVSRS